MFFVNDGIIVKINRLPGESNKTFFRKGYYVSGIGVESDAELKSVIADYNLKNKK